MSVHKSAVMGLAVAAVAAGVILRAQVPTPQQLPGAPMSSRNSMVTPRLEGWVRNADGTATILMGYFNRNPTPVDVPVGPANQIMPGGPDMGQPTRFLPGRQWGMFSITVPKDFGTKKYVWTVSAFNQPASITLWTNAPYAVSPYLSEFTGNTPPVAKFDPAGPELKGPPKGFAKNYTAAVGTPLTLTVWLKDAGPTLVMDPARARLLPVVAVAPVAPRPLATQPAAVVVVTEPDAAVQADPAAALAAVAQAAVVVAAARREQDFG